MGNWLGSWLGKWFGAGEPAPAGSLSGSASVSLTASGHLVALADVVGSASLALGVSGTASAVALLSGTAGINISAVGSLSARDPGSLGGVATLAIDATGTLSYTGDYKSTSPADTFSTGSGGGASYSDAGQGYIKTEHGWVKLTKLKKVGACAFTATLSITSLVEAGVAGTPAGSLPATTYGVASSSAGTACTEAGAIEANLSSSAYQDLDIAGANLTTYSAKVEWLDTDELLVLVDLLSI